MSYWRAFEVLQHTLPPCRAETRSLNNFMSALNFMEELLQDNNRLLNILLDISALKISMQIWYEIPARHRIRTIPQLRNALTRFRQMKNI